MLPVFEHYPRFDIIPFAVVGSRPLPLTQTVGCFLMTKEIWKEKKCYENVLVRDAEGFYKIELCGKSPTHRVQQYDYWFYLCDEHKNLYPSSKPIVENNSRAVFSPRLRWLVMERDGFKCVRCGRTAEDGIKLHVDHVHPKSRGGMATLDNGQTLCDECNIGKGALVPEEHPTQLAPDRLRRGWAVANPLQAS